MPQLSPVQIYDVARQAGFSPDQAVTMTAIAMAESGGNPLAHNPVGENSYGLWQINLDAHARAPWAQGLTFTDPLDNARAAYEVSGHGANISPWTVTHNGSRARYLQYEDEARAAAAARGEGDARGNFNGVRGYGDVQPAGAPGNGAPYTAGEPINFAPPQAAVGPDADRDGVSDSMEMSSGLDPAKPDSDADGLLDGFEVRLRTDAAKIDTDADGLTDAFEVMQLRTDPLKGDTDSDGVDDNLEVAMGRDPLFGIPGQGFGPPEGVPVIDTDADGLSDAFEKAWGADPNQVDTDFDGLGDQLEHAMGTDPLQADTDRDGFTDGFEVRLGENPLVAFSLDGAGPVGALGPVNDPLQAADPAQGAGPAPSPATGGPDPANDAGFPAP